MYATADDVRKLWGKATLTQEETDLVELRIAQAERLILRRIPDLADKIASGEIDVEDVKTVVCEAVLRVARNPDGYVQESDGNYSYMVATGSNAGRLYITEDEWELLGIYFSGLNWMSPKLKRPT